MLKRERLTMVEAFVSRFAEKLCDFLGQQVVFHQDEYRQLERAEYDLSWMRCFLQDVDSKEVTSEMLKKMVSEVRDLNYHAEEVIDNFIIGKVHRKRRRLLRPFYAPFDVWAQWKLGNEIEEINKKLHDLPQRILNYGIGNLGDLGEGMSSKGGSLQERRKTSPLLKDSKVVGIKNNIETLVVQLTGGESRLQVVSIVGMAGLGKTTLARKVYNNSTVKRHFNCCAWVCASQEYINHLLQSILMQFGILTIKESQMNDIQLQERLLEHLMETRCLLVLDDVWDCKAWNDFEPFMNANSGSRILLTTRHNTITSYPHTIEHELKCLDKDNSWKLFCMITFPEQGMKFPQNLKQIGKVIVGKCHGLPLAIVVMGGLLSGRKRHVCEWQKVLRSISSQIVKRNPKIEEILALSYKDLPYHLRLCFLYFGIFPEDHEFYAEKLMRLWVAEGFINPIQCETMEKTMEEVAEDYLDELIRRNLVQVAKKSSTGQVRSCRMHDLLRDLSISKAKEIKFLHINEHSPHSSKVRRLALYHRAHEQSSFHSSTTCLRSLSCFIPAGDRFSENQEKLLYGSFKFLRVLNLHGVLLRELPDEIDALIFLKYLGCRMTELESLPSSIGSLSNLQTLDVTSSKIVKIPNVIWKMQQLRHFHVKGTITECDNPPLELDFPSNIQTLTHVEVSKWVNDYLGKLNYLRKLGIWGKDSSEYRSGLSNAIPILKNLRYLKLGEWDDCCVPTLPPLMDHQNLCKLFLHGKLEKLPKSREFPPNLIKLTLRMTRLKDDPMPTLQKLKKLRILKLLDEAYSGREMFCSAKGFPQLESLQVVYLNNLEEWSVVKGAMQSLQHLCINYCMKLRGIPEELQHRTSLTLERNPLEQESNNEDRSPGIG